MPRNPANTQISANRGLFSALCAAQALCGWHASCSCLKFGAGGGESPALGTAQLLTPQMQFFWWRPLPLNCRTPGHPCFSIKRNCYLLAWVSNITAICRHRGYLGRRELSWVHGREGTMGSTPIPPIFACFWFSVGWA